MHARLVDPARHREAAQAVAVVATVAGEPVRASAVDLGYPVDGLDVVHQGRSIEQAALGDEGRSMAGLARLALEGLDQRRLLAADVGTGTPAQHDAAGRRQAGGLEFGDGLAQHLVQARVFVPQVDVAGAGLDHLGTDQHALQELVGRALQVVTILDRARLALVGVDHHVSRRRLGAHEGPLAEGREARTAETPQARGLEHRAQLVNAHPPGAQRLEQREAALGAISVEPLPVDRRRRQVAGCQHRLDRRSAGMAEVAMTDLHHRRLMAATHAWRGDHPHGARIGRRRQFGLKPVGARELARQRIAHPDRQRRRWRLVVVDDVEVGIEAGGLEHRGHRQAHPLCQGAQVPGRQMAEAILDGMQVLDQQVRRGAAARQQLLDLGQCGGIERAAARHATGPPAAPRGQIHRHRLVPGKTDRGATLGQRRQRAKQVSCQLLPATRTVAGTSGAGRCALTCRGAVRWRGETGRRRCLHRTGRQPNGLRRH